MKHRNFLLVALSVLLLGAGLTGCSQKKEATATPAVTPHKSQVVTTTMYSKKLHLDCNLLVNIHHNSNPYVIFSNT